MQVFLITFPEFVLNICNATVYLTDCIISISSQYKMCLHINNDIEQEFVS